MINLAVAYLDLLLPGEIGIGPDVELLDHATRGRHVREGHHDPIEDVGEVGQPDCQQGAFRYGRRRILQVS